MSKRYSSTSLHQAALSELREYFGFISNSDLISLATSIHAAEGSTDVSQAQQGFVSNLSGQGDTAMQAGFVDETQAVMSILLDVTEGAYFTYAFTTQTEIKQQLADIPQSLESGDFTAIMDYVQIVHEGRGTVDNDFVAVDSYVSGSSQIYQGMNRVVAPAKAIGPAEFQLCSKEEVGINLEEFAMPDKIKRPSLSSYVFPSMRIGPQTRDADAVAIFANSIPNVELNRCVPFINMIFYTDLPGENVQADKNGQMGILRFLGAVDHGSSPTESDITGLANVTPDIVFSQVEGGDLSSQILSDAGVDTSDQVRVGFAGMEMFTSPMTLANADINSSGYVSSHYGNKEILDPIRPLLTLDSLSVNIDGTGHAALASKTGRVTMKLHDRSRMSDIAPMISSDRYANTHVIIEYGWSHPEGGFDSSNAYGKFINSLRLKDVFNINYTEMTLNNTGEVDINMRLSNLGTFAATTAPIVAGRFIPLSIAKPLIDRYITSVINANSETESGAVLSEVRNKFEVGVGDGSQTASVVRRSIVSEIVDIAKRGDLSALSDAIISLVGEDGEGGELAEAPESAASEIGFKLKALERGIGGDIDVFFNDELFQKIVRFTSSGADNQSEFRNPEHYVSLGRVVCSFIGYPIASCMSFEEVQVMFYGFNSQAGAMRPYSTCNFPIKLVTLKDRIENMAFGSDGGDLARMPSTTDMMSLLTELVANPQDYAYGLTDLYEEYEEGSEDAEAVRAMDEDEREAYYEARQEEALVLSDRQSQRLNMIYNEDGLGGTPDFKQPQLQFYLEPVPGLFINEDGSKGPAEGTTILRIHVFDKSASPHMSELFMLRMANDSEIAMRYNTVAQGEQAVQDWRNENEDALVRAGGRSGTSFTEQEQIVIENSLAGPVSEFTSYVNSLPSWVIKESIKTTVPSITMGSMFTAVKNASVSSTTSGAVSRERMVTANLDRQDNQEMQGAGSSVDDIFVIPATLDIKMFGIPLLNYAQQFFIDLGTGTTLDNLYTATHISHTINSSGFETSFKCTFQGSGGTKNLRNSLISAIPSLESEQ